MSYAKVILNSEVLKKMLSENEIGIIKYSSRNGFDNYFFGPNMSIKLFSAKVAWIDANAKNLSFVFDKVEYTNLLNLLKFVNSSLLNIYNEYKEYRGFDELQIKPSIFFEKENNFYVRCMLPGTKGRYFIKSTENTYFGRPRVGQVFDSVIIDIRNIWESNRDKIGFNLELKETTP